MGRTVATAAAILVASVVCGVVGARVLEDLAEDLQPKKMPAVHVTIPADVPEKPGVPYLIVKKGDKVPNIAPPVELHIAGTTLEECNDMGGKYQARNKICLDVDY